MTGTALARPLSRVSVGLWMVRITGREKARAVEPPEPLRASAHHCTVFKAASFQDSNPTVSFLGSPQFQHMTQLVVPPATLSPYSHPGSSLSTPQVPFNIRSRTCIMKQNVKSSNQISSLIIVKARL